MSDFYLNPDGSFPSQNGQPVIISQSDFEDCCCKTYCRWVYTFIGTRVFDRFGVDPIYNCVDDSGGASYSPYQLVLPSKGTYTITQLGGAYSPKPNPDRWYYKVYSSFNSPSADYKADFLGFGTDAFFAAPESASGSGAGRSKQFTWTGGYDILNIWIYDGIYLFQRGCVDHHSYNITVDGVTYTGPTLQLTGQYRATYVTYVEKTGPFCVRPDPEPEPPDGLCGVSGTWINSSATNTEVDAISADNNTWECEQV